MKKPLRIALQIAIFVIAIALFLCRKQPWFPWPGKENALSICGWSLLAIANTISPDHRAANIIRAGLACAVLGVGIAALLKPLSETVVSWAGYAAIIIFVASVVNVSFGSHKANKKKETPQETPQ